MKKLKIITALLFSVVALVLIFSPLGTILKYRLFPDPPSYQSQTLQGSDLGSPVNLYFDDMGVAHIEANSLEDAAYAVGFLQWRDRGWQMDLMRHFGSGRMSELLGEQQSGHQSTIELDLAMRSWDLLARTPKSFDELSSTDQKLMKAFLSGLSFAQERFKPIEHRILGIEPQSWTYKDVYLISLVQAWSLSHNWEQELVRYLLSRTLGIEKASAVYPHIPTTDLTTIDGDEDYAKLPPAVVRETRSFLKDFKIKSSMGPSILEDLFEWRPAASNAWAISPSKTMNNKAIIANDMHLNHLLPSLLYLMHIKTPDYEMRGVTLPGLAVPVSGDNGKVAWGITSTVADVIDLVIEKPHANRTDLVASETGECKLSEKKITIKVKDAKDRHFTVRQSCHGFFLNDAYPTLFSEDDPAIAIKWNSHTVGNTLQTLVKAGRSKDVFELRSALQQLNTPVQNVTTADALGNIGFFTMGKIPYRKNYRGTFPVPGWLAKYEWKKYSKASDLPATFNPKSGYLINTNNMARPTASHPLLVQIDSAPNYRIQRVKELLEESEHNLKKNIMYQGDTFVHRARYIMGHIRDDLEKIKPENQLEADALEELLNWDYFSHADSIGMSIFASLYRHSVLRALFHVKSEGIKGLFLRQRYSTNIVDLWYEKKDHFLWDDPRTDKLEQRIDNIHASFKDAIISLRQLDSKMTAWQWGRLHFHKPMHVFGKKSILSFFNLNRTQLAGSLDSVWKAHFNLGAKRDPFRSVAGPAYRFVKDFSRDAQIYTTLDTGISGWPMSEHYSDMYELWSEGKLYAMPVDWNTIKEEFSQRKLLLTPAKN